MTVIKIVSGNLLDSEEKIICQQCNCVTIKARGLSEQIAKRFPWADIYKRRTQSSRPGFIQVDKDPLSDRSDRTIIHMFAQWIPGASGSYAYKKFEKVSDGPEDRIRYFKECLSKIETLNLNEPIAMPYQIGCGLAHGDWSVYKKILEDCSLDIVLYKL